MKKTEIEKKKRQRTEIDEKKTTKHGQLQKKDSLIAN
jgi:hypothetical protein